MLRIQNAHLIALVFIIALGVTLRLEGIEFESYWYDEIFSYDLAHQPMSEMLSQAREDVHPPLYYIFLHFWIQIFDRDVSLRLSSILWALLTFPVVYLAATKAFGRRAGLLATLLLAVSPFHIKYSQSLRMYTMYPFFMALSFCFLVYAVKEQKRLYWVLLGVANAFMFLTHYHSAFQILAEALFVCAYAAARRDRKTLFNFALSCLAMLLCLAPSLPFVLHQWQRRHLLYFWVPIPKWVDLPMTIFFAYFYGLEVIQVGVPFMWVFSISVVAILFVNDLTRRHEKSEVTFSALFYTTTFFPLFFTFLLSYGHMKYFYLWKYSMLTFVPFIFLMAYWINRLQRETLVAVFAAILALNGITSAARANYVNTNPHWRELVRLFEARATQDTLLLGYPYDFLNGYNFYATRGIPLLSFAKYVEQEQGNPRNFYLLVNPNSGLKGALTPFLQNIVRRYAHVKEVFNDGWIELLDCRDAAFDQIAQWYFTREWIDDPLLKNRELEGLYRAEEEMFDRNSGFGSLEVGGDFSYFRWTRTSPVRFTIAKQFSPGMHAITMKLIPHFPEVISVWHYGVTLNDEYEKRIVKPAEQPYATLFVPVRTNTRQLTVEIESTLFNPLKLGIGKDDRDLGVMFFWLAIAKPDDMPMPQRENFLLLDMGNFDEGVARLEGFHEKESSPRSDFRWTDRESRIYFDLPDAASTNSLKRMRLRVYAPRPDALEQPYSSFMLNAQPLGSLTVPKDPVIYEFAIPNGLLKPKSNCFSIFTETWQPCANEDSQDDRQLGLILDWIMMD